MKVRKDTWHQITLPGCLSHYNNVYYNGNRVLLRDFEHKGHDVLKMMSNWLFILLKDKIMSELCQNTH